MAEHNELGELGEELAADYLSKKGYVIKERNWFHQKAEIDIVAEKNGVLIAVEVKTRTSRDFGLPQDFVDQKKKKMLIKAMDAYVNLYEIDLEIRFDIVAVYKEKKGFNIEHIEDAFYFF